MGLRMESCRPWWCCSGSAPPPPGTGTGTGTALGPGGWPRLCSDGSPGGGGLSSSAGLDDEWSGVPDGVFSSSELPSTDLPLPFSEAASGLWLLELEFSLFSLQVQEQSRGSARKRAARRRAPGARAAGPSGPEPPALRTRRSDAAAFGPGLGRSPFLPVLNLSTPTSLFSPSLHHLCLPASRALSLMKTFPAPRMLFLPMPLADWLTLLSRSRGAGAQGSLVPWSWVGGQGKRKGRCLAFQITLGSSIQGWLGRCGARRVRDTRHRAPR